MKKLVPWIGYSGSTLQNSYGEDLQHGYLVWDLDTVNKRHDVKFVNLINPRPFVTVEWQGNVDDTFELAKDWPDGSRFRIRSFYSIPSAEATTLSSKLRNERFATEVVFKFDDKDSNKRFATASVGLDVSNLCTLETMLKEYYGDEHLDDDVFSEMLDELRKAHVKVTSSEHVSRGTYWTIKKLEFDNLYGYGQNNVINFENKSGIVGIFGPNKIGKSSIVGAITYTLFNSSDRDVSKSAYIVNTKAKSCQSKAVISVAGSEYEIERATNKVISRGALTANTTLSLKQLDGEGHDLTGEQRSDTEKNLRGLIGTYEDFAFTGGQVQDDVSRFLKEGATQRKSILSKFLGIDIFEKLYANLNEDLSNQKSKLKTIQSIEILKNKIEELQSEIAKNEQHIKNAVSRKEQLSSELLKNKLVVHSLKESVEQARNGIAKNDELRKNVERQKSLQEKIQSLLLEIEDKKQSIAANKTILDACDSWSTLTDKHRLLNEAKLELSNATQLMDNATRDLERSKKISLKLLDVPCGDSYPTCVYIKDAHEEKLKLSSLISNLERHVEHVTLVKKSLSDVDENAIAAMSNKRKLLEAELQLLTNSLDSLMLSKTAYVTELEECEKYLKTNSALDDNLDSSAIAKYDSAEAKVDELHILIDSVDKDINAYHVMHGKLESNIVQLHEQIEIRESIQKKLRTKELLTNAFSRKGIPNLVLSRLLPVVNEEISRIIDGVVNFRVILRADEDTNALDILLDDGVGEPRPLELGSGMERMISSLAIRAALSNVTTLPKPDFMIIDEGFGSLDDVNSVACVSMLKSLKRWFRFILVISHVDIIKDAVDIAIEVSNNGVTSRVVA